jgi:phosphohistidine phosphatase SixA
VPYGEEDVLRFKEEMETARRELEDVSKKAGIAELEWEDQRKQLLETIDGTALNQIFDPTRLLMLISLLLALCSPRRRARTTESAGGAAG